MRLDTSTRRRLPSILRVAPLLVILVSVPGLAVSACGGEGSTSTGANTGLDQDLRLERAGYAVDVDADTLTLTMTRGDDELLRFPVDAFQLGAVDEITETYLYDPYPMLVESAFSKQPPGLRWLKPKRATLLEATSDAFEIRLTFDEGKEAVLRVAAAADGRFRCQLTPSEQGVPVAVIRMQPRVDETEGFYGLGEYFDGVNHRGKVRAMQFEVDGSQESSYNEAHVPIPLLIGTRGWGLFVESFYTGLFDVASQQADLVDVAFGVGSAATAGLTFHLMGAEHPLDVTKHYYEVTGYPLLPARWALGPWVWRDENENQAQVESDIETMRDLDLPASGIWIDRPYATAVNSFDFDSSMFTDPVAMVDFAHEMGFRMALWHTPYLDEDHEATKVLHEEALAKGYYPPTSGILANGWGNIIDYTNPEAFAWWQGLIHRYTDMGIEGFKLDYAEDIVPGIFGGRNIWEFYDGRDDRTMHAEYQYLYHQVYAQTLPTEGGFLICRAATIGDQVNVSVIWPGDLDANMAKHKEHVVDGDEEYNAVGGLPAALIASLTLGPSGFPFFGSDTGGYRHSPTDKETFTRWFEHTSLSSVMQIGTSTNEVAWEFKEGTGFDQEMLDWYRIYTRLHLRLFPYEWTYAERIATDGRPIQRALGLAYPELGVHPDDTYLFGDDLLVAPVVERGARERDVVFPPGVWIDWWDGARYEGNQTAVVDAPLGKLPLYLREGGIIPMLRPTIDSMAPTLHPEQVDSYATTPGVLHARIAAGAATSFALFDGAELGQELDGDTLVLTSHDGKEFTHGAIFEVIAVRGAPSSVQESGVEMIALGAVGELDQATTGWVHAPSERGGTLYVKVSAGDREVTAKF
jgi:alpha-D-xyloside xylohydrolase